VFLVDPDRPAVGMIHAGWRSTQTKITTKTVELMRREFNTNPGNLSVSFGPAIGPGCFEVEEEFKQFFPGKVINRQKRLFLDLPRINKDELLESGVKEGNIFDPGICTACETERFFSYRQEKESAGRMISVIMLL
jgi:YfiH family protein